MVEVVTNAQKGSTMPNPNWRSMQKALETKGNAPEVVDPQVAAFLAKHPGVSPQAIAQITKLNSVLKTLQFTNGEAVVNNLLGELDARISNQQKVNNQQDNYKPQQSSNKQQEMPNVNNTPKARMG